MPNVSYIVQVAYKNIITPQTQFKYKAPQSPSKSLTPIPKSKPNYIRNTVLKALWLSLPKTFTGVIVSALTFGTSILVKYWWYRLPLYEVDNQTVYYVPKKVQKQKQKDLIIKKIEIDPYEFNPIVNTLANQFGGRNLFQFSKMSHNFVRYIFGDSGSNNTNASPTVYNVKAFIASLPQNIFVHLVVKVDHKNGVKKLLFPQNIPEPINMTKVAYSDMIVNDKNIYDSVDKNIDKYETYYNLDLNVFKLITK